jgi:hypothetical protein
MIIFRTYRYRHARAFGTASNHHGQYCRIYFETLRPTGADGDTAEKALSAAEFSYHNFQVLPKALAIASDPSPPIAIEGIDPVFSEAYFNRALSYYQLKNFDK